MTMWWKKQFVVTLLILWAVFVFVTLTFRCHFGTSRKKPGELIGGRMTE